MPGFDGTGPRGTGSMTGRGRGYCAVPIANSSGYTEQSITYTGTYSTHRRRRPFDIIGSVSKSKGLVHDMSLSRGSPGWRSRIRGYPFGRGRRFGRRW